MVNIWDMLFPSRCVGCGKWGSLVCEKCEIGMGEADQICPGCGRNSRGGVTHPNCRKLTVLDGLTCMWEYEGIVKKLIGDGKYRSCFDNLNKLVEMRKLEKYEVVGNGNFGPNQTVVVPVPLYFKRERKRGFNQAEIISKKLGLILNLKTRNLLIRIKDTGRQVGRSRDARLVAMKGAFKIKSNFQFSIFNQSSIYNNQITKNILLVDDVWTTGATMRECAKTLKKGGYNRIWGFVLAR